MAITSSDRPSIRVFDMKVPALSPGVSLSWALLCAASVLGAVFTYATSQPWLGLRLTWDEARQAAVVRAAHGPAEHIAPGTAIVAVAASPEPVGLTGEDFTLEPDANLPTFTVYRRFLGRQERLSALQAAPTVGFIDSDGHTHVVRPLFRRPWTDLPVEFWVQVTVGLFAWLISAGVWAFRPREPSARYLLASGFSTLLFAPLAAVYSTRELALPAMQFLWLSDLNFFGGSLYCATMVAILWYYPRRLGAMAVGPMVLVAFLGWFAAQELGAFESMVVARRTPVFVSLLLTFALSAVQWRATRSDPVARAAFSWFLLSWLLGTTAFATLTMVPQLFGIQTDALQGYAFLLFLLVYGGLAFGILRFRLFQLGEWWFRIFSWLLGGAILVSMDLALAAFLSFPASVSLALAVLICGFLWLPLRGWLWTRLVEPRAFDVHQLFKSVLHVAFAPSLDERSKRWADLMKRLFDPLRVETSTGNVSTVRIEEEGLSMVAPTIEGVEALRLTYAAHGRRLFAPRDAQLLQQAVDMLRHVDESREAYNQGAFAERTRIARDLHDDIGSRLLSGLHQSRIDQTKDVIEQTLAEMRTIIHGLTGHQLTVDNVIAELREETWNRLEAAGIALDWPLGAPHGEVVLSYAIYKNYLSVMRELVANVIRHARATHVRVHVSIDGESIVSEVEDDGVGFDGAAKREGYGLPNLRRRLSELGGALSFARERERTSARVTIPLSQPVAELSQVSEARP